MRYILSLLCCTFALSIFAQTLAPAAPAVVVDSNYKRPYYEQRVSLFKLLPTQKKSIVFLGNSITDGGEWTELLACKRCVNRGISGDISLGVLARIDDVAQTKPAKIFLLIGINDINRYIPNERIVANYNAIVQRVRTLSPQTEIYLQSVLPINDTMRKFAPNAEANITVLNQALRALAQHTPRAHYVDLFGQFADKDGKLDKRYTNDGLHLMGEGYLLWMRIIQPLIR